MTRCQFKRYTTRSIVDQNLLHWIHKFVSFIYVYSKSMNQAASSPKKLCRVSKHLEPQQSILSRLDLVRVTPCHVTSRHVTEKQTPHHAYTTRADSDRRAQGRETQGRARCRAPQRTSRRGFCAVCAVRERARSLCISISTIEASVESQADRERRTCRQRQRKRRNVLSL